MKILLLTPDIPFPSESGAAIRNWGIIDGLAAAGHRITLLSFLDQPGDMTSNPLIGLCEAVHTVPLQKRSRLSRLVTLCASRRSDMELRLWSDDFAAMLSNLLRAEAYDIVQFSGLELGCYLDLILAEKGAANVVYDALNAEADLQRIIATVDSARLERLPIALYSRAQARRLQSFEERICGEVDAVIAVSEEDRDLLKVYGGAPISVMPNGINVDDYGTEGIDRAASQLVFTGKMDYRPNVDAMEWFCAAVLPRVREHAPDARLTVVGRNPHPRLAALENDAVHVTGWVNTVLPHLHEATLFVVPLRMGSGTRLKILQAMAAGCAVVSTSIGAAGLASAVRDALEIADTAEEFAEKIVTLLRDDVSRRELGLRAQEQVRDHHDWQVLIPKLLSVYKRLGSG